MKILKLTLIISYKDTKKNVVYSYNGILLSNKKKKLKINTKI
jgi:hypothetical protein